MRRPIGRKNNENKEHNSPYCEWIDVNHCERVRIFIHGTLYEIPGEQGNNKDEFYISIYRLWKMFYELLHLRSSQKKDAGVTKGCF